MLNNNEEELGYKTEAYEYSPQVHPRILYIRKLYFMLSLQLLLVGIFTSSAYYSSQFKLFLSSHSWIFFVSLGLGVLILFMAFFFREKLKLPVINWIVFIFFTLCLSFNFSYLVSIDKSDLALMVFITTFFVNFSLLIYSLTTKIELTYQGASLFIFASLLFSLQIFLIFTAANFGGMILVLIGELIFSYYLVFDTQTLISGNLYNWDKEDWISGAVVIYIDIFFLFLRLCDLLRQLIFKERN